MSDAVVTCRSVGKTFRIPRSDERTLRGRILRPGSTTAYEEFRALERVDVEVRRGEFFGVVGRNGSGKSTLLKLLAGIYQLDRGQIEIDGSIAPFIELGVGFNEDLSARDNVFINGAILGMSRRQVEARYDAIVSFAELQQFMGMKLRNFSSGMLMRLAFAIAVQSGAEILLVDEVLAVGDGRFQRKCQEVFRERKRRGETVIFVSHDMHAVEAFCDRVLLLEQGRQVDVGPPARIVPQYHELNRPLASDASPDIEQREDGADELPVLMRRFDLQRHDGRPMDRWQADDTLHVELEIDSTRALGEVLARVLVLNEGGGLVGSLEAPIGTLETGAGRIIAFDVTNILGSGTYSLEAEVHAVVDSRPRLVGAPRRRELLVDAAGPTGVVRIPHSIAVTRVAADPVAHLTDTHA